MSRFLLLAILTVTQALPASNQMARSVTIHRDTFGVPHIRAKTDAGAIFGLMYAQAEDNFWQLETDIIRIIGRSAEVDGARGIATDLLVRAYESEKRAKEDYARATPQQRALCDAFAAGLNYFLETHPQVKPRLITKFEPWFILAEERRGPAGTTITAAERQKAFPGLSNSVETADLRFPGGPNRTHGLQFGPDTWFTHFKRLPNRTLASGGRTGCHGRNEPLWKKENRLLQPGSGRS